VGFAGEFDDDDSVCSVFRREELEVEALLEWLDLLFEG
jgi:hypothetical protein